MIKRAEQKRDIVGVVRKGGQIQSIALCDGDALDVYKRQVVFLCSGLWHGAAWTFVAWGLLHGLYLVCGRLTLPLRKRLYKSDTKNAK